MEIQTKYDIGDILWTIDHEDVKKFTVQEIRIGVGKAQMNNIIGWEPMCFSKDVFIEYAGNNIDYHAEDKCFRTKEDLINSL